MKGIIKNILQEEISISLPIRLSGSFKVPKNITSRGDALHSFDRRKMDGFGGYMLRGGPVPGRWAGYVNLNQGKGINQVLRELADKGIAADVTDINVRVNNDMSVNWDATIDKSRDGKSYIGVFSRGSAGGGADSRALNQVSSFKSKNTNFCNWKEVLDLNVSKPIKIRQYFIKYTNCKEGEKSNTDIVKTSDKSDEGLAKVLVDLANKSKDTKDLSLGWDKFIKFFKDLDLDFLKENKNEINKNYNKKKEIGLRFLNSLHLEPWKSKEYSMEYLATPKGKIIFLNSDDLSLSIQAQIYDMLIKIMGSEVVLAKLAKDFLSSKGVKSNFSYIERSISVGDIEDDDEPMTQNLQESTNKNPLKQYFFKVWDKEKREGKVPMIGNLERLGLSSKRNEIIQYFGEFMGWDTNSKYEGIKMYLLHHIFTEDYITEMKDIPQGKITIKFTDIEIEPGNETEDNSFTGSFVVLDGSFLEPENNEVLHFSSGDIPVSDFVEYFEFKDEISRFVEHFVEEIFQSFGFKYGGVDYPYVKFEW